MTTILEDCVQLAVELSDDDNVEDFFGRSDGEFCDDVYNFYEDSCHDTVNEEGPCCSEAKDLYLERCNEVEDALRADVGFCITISLLVASFFLRTLISGYQVYWLPEAGAAILVGLVVGALLRVTEVHDLAFSDSAFMRVLLPPIILAATVSLDKRAFRSNFGIVMAFAVVGTLLATSLTGVIVYYVAEASDECNLSFVEAMLFGTAISSIDPIAVLVIFKSAGMPENHPVYVALFGESVLNDGVVFLLFHLLVQFLDGADASTEGILTQAGFFVLGILGSIAVGLVIPHTAGYAFAALKGRIGPLMESSILVMVALLPYYVANALEWSGVVAIVLSGLSVEPYVLRKVSRPARRIFRVVLEFFSVVFETFVFAYVGIFMVLVDYAFCPLLLFGALTACIGGRAMHVYPAACLLNRWNRRRNIRRAASLASLRDVDAAYSAYDPPNSAVSNVGLTLEAGDDGPDAANEEDGRNGAGNEDADDGQRAQNVLHVSRASLSADDHQPLTGGDPHDAPLGPGFFRMFDAASSMGMRDMLAMQDVVMEEAPLYTWTDQFLMFFCSMRGAVSFALVQAIPTYDLIRDQGSKGKDTLVFLTTTIIIFSVFLVGGVATPVIQRIVEKKQDREATDPENDFAYRNMLQSSMRRRRDNSGLDTPFLMHGYERQRSRDGFDGQSSPSGDGDTSDSDSQADEPDDSGGILSGFFGRKSRQRRTEGGNAGDVGPAGPASSSFWRRLQADPTPPEEDKGGD